jgi:hypothetical protein
LGGQDKQGQMRDKDREATVRRSLHQFHVDQISGCELLQTKVE